MRRVLITGASGLIGKSIVGQLINESYRVMALDKWRAKEFDQLNSNGFRFIQGDCQNYGLIKGLMSDCDLVIHLAAPSSFLMYKENPRGSTINTIQSMLNLLEAMKAHSVKKIVHASTSAIYEGNPVPYHETMIIRPPDLKALSKKVNEEMAEQYSDSYGITAIHMRPFSVYGEGETEKGGYANVISLFAWAMVAGNQPVVWSDGEQTRDFIHAEDAAKAFIMAAEADIPTQALNLGTGKETTFNQVIALINQQLGANIQAQYIDVPIDIYAQRLLSDNSRLEQVLGFRPRVELTQGIERVVNQAKKLVEVFPEMAQKQLYFRNLQRKQASNV